MLGALIHVNGQLIGNIDIQRKITGDDGLNEYDWSIRITDQHGRVTKEEGQALQHHYQDGALVLISKVLDASGHGP